MDPTPALASIGIDIGKEVFHVVGFGADGKIAFRRKIKRLALAETFSKQPPCIVGMGACLSAHFVSRALRQLGHEPRIIPAIYVKPFAKGQKNDYNDAEAEAALRPNLRTVREETQDQPFRPFPIPAPKRRRCGRAAPEVVAYAGFSVSFQSLCLTPELVGGSQENLIEAPPDPGAFRALQRT